MDDTLRRAHERLDSHERRITTVEADLRWMKDVPKDIGEMKSQLAGIAQQLAAQADAAKARQTGQSGHLGLLQALVLLVVGGLVGAGVKALGG